MKNRGRDYFLLGFLALIWSTSFLLIKVSVDSIPPFTLTAGRLTLAAFIFSAYLAYRRESIPLTPRAILIYVVMGVVGNALPFALISWGEVFISSSLTALLMGIMPIFTFILAHIFISSEPMTRRKTLGVSLGFLGLVVLVGISSLGELGQNLVGQLAVLGGATCYAIATVFVRTQPAFEGYKMAAGMSIVAAVISIAMAFVIEDPLAISPTPVALWSMIILGVFPTALAALIYFRIINSLGATTFAQINYIVPVLGGMWGVLFLGETLGLNVFFALAMVMCGIYLVQTRSRKNRMKTEPA